MLVRRGAGAVGLALVATVLGPLGGTPAQATPGCTSEARPSIEVVPGLPVPQGDGCDDSTPPETAVTASPTPNAAGLVAAASITFSFASPPPADGDPDPVGFECRLTGSPQQHDWRQCTSPVTYAGLPDAAAGSYAFAVRAVDLADAGRNPDDGLPPAVADTPDVDPTPAAVSWGQDTRAPFVFVTPETYDGETPTQPVVTSRRVPLRLNSSERGSRFECTDSGRAVACEGGRWALTGARSGRHVFTARSIDAAGNASAWSEPVEFFVPKNLQHRKGWKKQLNRNWFDGDAVTTRQRGARLVLPRTRVGELRLYAATGPRYGKVRLRVGRRAWHVVDLRGPRSAMKEFVVLDRYSGVRRGRVTIENLTGRRVVLAAVVARPNTFPSGT
jgi:hypothetical protein